MLKQHAGLMLAGWALAVGGSAAPLAEATYAKYFDRAGALLPGLTVVERDLTRNYAKELPDGKHYGDQVQREMMQAGTWTISGGRQVECADGIAAEASGDIVEFTWKITSPRAHPEFLMQFKFAVDTPAPLQMQFHVGGDDRFNKLGNMVEINPAAAKPLDLRIPPPSRRDAARSFGGVKLVFTGPELAGRKITLKHPRLISEFHEGFFRHAVEIPAGEIWEAVAEVGDFTTLYVNGRRVDDASIIMPRPVKAGPKMYGSRRVDLKKHLQPGRNVLGLHVQRAGGVPSAYLRGSAVMASGERILLDSGTNWVWNRAAPDNWFAPDYDDAGWLKIFSHADMPRELGINYSYRGPEAVSSQASNFGFSYRPRGSLPCHDGFIKLRNPSDKKFFFNENNPFRLEVMLPPGFRDKKPELAWEISRYDGPGAEKGGTFTEVAAGRVEKFEYSEPSGQLTGTVRPTNAAVPNRSAGSFAGEINAARLPRGIYVFTSRLQINGAVIEEREPEAMVMTGKVKMPPSAGDKLEQGMDLKLEQTIDFTDPADPHPSFETDHQGPIPAVKWGTNYYHTVAPALIVERNGLKYRETRPVTRAQFSYQVEFAHPGDWYLLVLEYPDDAERWIGVSCNADRVPEHLRRAKPEERYSACSKCGPGIWTGGKYPNTGRMLEMKWIYRPDPGGHAINVMSLMKNTAAAAARLRIYHVAGRLPELDAGGLPAQEQRRFGMVTERTYPWENGIYNLFSSFENRHVNISGSRGAGQYTNNVVVDWCEHLRLMEDAASHYAEYMRFAGQNLHTMGCFQYDDGNTASQYVTGDPRIHDSSENMLARVLAANGLLFYASVEFICTERLGRQELDPAWYFADRAGNRAINLWAGKPLNLNFLHPAVEAEMLEVARQLAQGFKDQPNFLGINWTTVFSGFMIPSYRTHTYPYNYEEDPLGNGYDDLTVGLFEKDTGITLPVSGDQSSVNSDQRPESSDIYEQRYQFLTSEKNKPAWLAWRSQKMAEFFAKVNRVISEVRPGLETVAGCYIVKENLEEWKSRGTTFSQHLDAWGWNPTAFQDRDGIWLMPWLPLAARYAPSYRSEKYAFGWQGNKDPDFYRAFAGLDRRAIMLHAGWIEVERVAANYPYREGWPRPYQQTMMAQQRVEMAQEPYTQAMIGMDPQMIMMGFTDQTPYIGVEEMQRKFARVLRRLPWGRFEPVLDTGFDSNLAIRALRAGDDYLFYVANPGYWPISGTLTIEGATQVHDLVSGKAVVLKGGMIEVALEPFGIAAFRAVVGSSSDHRSLLTDHRSLITDWKTDPVAEPDLAHMRNILRQARDAAENKEMPAFLGEADYGILTGGIAAAEQALAEGRYAAAWAALTEADFWTVLFQQTPEIKFVAVTRPRELTALRVAAEAAPRTDGALDEAVWRTAAARPADAFVTRDKEYSALPTTVRAAWSGNRLFIAVECPDPEPDQIRGTTDREDVKNTIWASKDDLIALFIMPADQTPADINYYQLAVSANGAQFDQHNRIRQGLHTRNYEYAPDWKAVTGRNDKGWTLEVELDTVEAFGVPLRAGAEWKLNVHRQFRFDKFPVSSWTFNPGEWHSLRHMGSMKIE